MEQPSRPDDRMTTSPSDNAEWIREVLAEYERPLVRYAVRIVHDLETAQDVVQDAFLKLIRADRAEVEDHVAEWLFTVCRNRCLDVLRKDRRMTTMTEGHEPTRDQPPDVPPPEAAASGESRSEVLQLVASLPERQQEVLRLKFQGGLSYREISRVTDLSVSNVGFLIHTGLKTVREKLRVQATQSQPKTNLGIAR